MASRSLVQLVNNYVYELDNNMRLKRYLLTLLLVAFCCDISFAAGSKGKPVSAIDYTIDLQELFGDNYFIEVETAGYPSRKYKIGKFEVTQKQWKTVMGSNPSFFKNCGDNCPVEQVSWNDVQEFLLILNQKTGKKFRLPTSEEWHTACRSGGSPVVFNPIQLDYIYCGEDNANNVAWYNANSEAKTHPAGQKHPNRIGIHDMSGNVWEWVQDRYSEEFDYFGVQTNFSRSSRFKPRIPQNEAETKRMVHGGSWFSGLEDMSFFYSDVTLWLDPSYRGFMVGFRLAQD